MNRTLQRMLGLLLVVGAFETMLGCELIVQLDDALVDSGPDARVVCTICDPDTAFDAGIGDAATLDQRSVPESAALDAIGEKPPTPTRDAKAGD